MVTNYGLQFFSEQFGTPIRNDVHGVDIYEIQEGLRFARSEANFDVGKSVGAFVEELRIGINRAAFSDKQLLAAELFSTSFFDETPRSRFITLVLAVEALLDPHSRTIEIQQFVSEIQSRVGDLSVSSETKQSLRSAMEWLKRDSIGHTGRLLVRSLLSNRIYAGMPADSFFAHCYGIRSQIVHNGRPKDAAINMLGLANETQRFVQELLIESFAVSASYR